MMRWVVWFVVVVRGARGLVNRVARPPTATAPRRGHFPVGMTTTRSDGGLRIMEWIPSQQALVKTARFGWRLAWRTMMAELAPQSAMGDYVRPAPQRLSESVAVVHGEAGRYVLYLGNACPWCHRCALMVALRSLGTVVQVRDLDDDPTKARRGGWTFRDRDDLFDCADLKGVYDACAPGGTYRGRVTAPVLVDLRPSEGRPVIVSNESAEIVRALARLRGAGIEPVDLCPEDLRPAIDALNGWIYDDINNGVYRAGFATTQQAYDRAEADVHAGLARVDAILGKTRFLAGEVLTEADVRLLPTVDRFDACYATLFRCGRKTVAHDYAHVNRWHRDLRRIPGVPETVDVQRAAESYFTNLFPLNPSGIVPKLPIPTQPEDTTTTTTTTTTITGALHIRDLARPLSEEDTWDDNDEPKPDSS